MVIGSSMLGLCSVLTPYYKENVVYSKDDLMTENEDGISVLFYLQKIYPG
jgi:callose synthase